MPSIISGKTFIIQGFGQLLRRYPVPIYAYRCETCGFSKDVLQKISDAPLTDCPSCAKSTFKKQVTAAGFQLKGTGWYVTDFRNGSGGTSKPATGGSGDNAGSAGSTGSASSSAAPAADSGSSSAAAPASTAPTAS
jgi:putative FmdB family regulatory protein